MMREGAVMYFLWFVLWCLFFFPKKFCFGGFYCGWRCRSCIRRPASVLYLGSQRSGPLGGDLSL